MSSVSKNARAYRQRKVGIKTVMPIYFERDIPDFDEEASLQRTVPLVESGVEKEEEEVSANPRMWKIMKSTKNLGFLMDFVDKNKHSF